MNPVTICVHQIGKVGSTSVVETLRDLMPGETIHQTHGLSERRMLDSIRRWLERSRRMPGFKPQYNLLSSIELSGYLQAGFAHRDWYVLSLVREPIGRNVSAFFQNLELVWVHRLSPTLRETCVGLLKKKTNEASDAEVIHEIAKALVAIYRENYHRRFMDKWFDDEMKPVFNIDVLAEPFPRERGCQIYRNEGVRLLLLRIEDLAAAFEPAMREWLRGSPWEKSLGAAGSLELKRANEAGNKNYALIHREFLAQLTFTPDEVEFEYTSLTARHFYSGAELRDFTAKWLKITPSPQPASIAS